MPIGHTYRSHMKLTDKFLRSVKPTAKHQFIADGNNLYLRVHPSGTKQFVFRSRQGGRARWDSIGTYPELSLLEARRKALDLVGSQLPEVVTVAVLADTYKKRVLDKQFKRPDIPWDRIQANVLPVIGKVKVSTLSKRDMFRVIEPILSRGSHVMANRVLSDLKHMMEFAVQRGWLTDDPAASIKRKHVGGKEKSRDRNLSWGEIDDLLVALGDNMRGKRGMNRTTIAALYLCLVTGQRASEVLWMMANFKGEPWIVLPGEVVKTTPYHKVYLSVQARAALKLSSNFPPPKDHRVLSHALRRIGATFTPHDLRRTMATRLADLGVMPHVAEKMLNHQMTGPAAVYNRAEYLPERMAAWRLWGVELAKKRRASKS